jgi:hypothetical protein
MPHQYIEAPNKVKIKNQLSVFLAGGISNCEDWQSQAARALEPENSLTVINPRRNDWKMDGSQVEESVIQIAWEFEYIRKVTDILFWFTDDTLQPITLYELGAALERNHDFWNGDENGQRVFIGVDKNYKRALDVKVQAKLVGYKWPVRENLGILLNDLVQYQNSISH